MGIIWKFFKEHPLKSKCYTAQLGQSCYEAVKKAMQEHPSQHPEWEGKISENSTFEEYQSVLHYGILADCPRPCERQTPFIYRKSTSNEQALSDMLPDRERSDLGNAQVAQLTSLC